MSPKPTSMTLPARNANTTAAKQVVTFSFFGDQPHRRLVRGLGLHLTVPLTVQSGAVSLSRPMSGRMVVGLQKKKVNTCIALWSFSAGIIVQVGYAAFMSRFIKANFGLP